MFVDVDRDPVVAARAHGRVDRDVACSHLEAETRRLTPARDEVEHRHLFGAQTHIECCNRTVTEATPTAVSAGQNRRRRFNSAVNCDSVHCGSAVALPIRPAGQWKCRSFGSAGGFAP